MKKDTDVSLCRKKGLSGAEPLRQRRLPAGTWPGAADGGRSSSHAGAGHGEPYHRYPSPRSQESRGMCRSLPSDVNGITQRAVWISFWIKARRWSFFTTIRRQMRWKAPSVRSKICRRGRRRRQGSASRYGLPRRRTA